MFFVLFLWRKTIKTKCRAVKVAQVVHPLPSKCKALSSNPTLPKKLNVKLPQPKPYKFSVVRCICFWYFLHKNDMWSMKIHPIMFIFYNLQHGIILYKLICNTAWLTSLHVGSSTGPCSFYSAYHPTVPCNIRVMWSGGTAEKAVGSPQVLV
jgi:hypothetical protein